MRSGVVRHRDDGGIGEQNVRLREAAAEEDLDKDEVETRREGGGGEFVVVGECLIEL